MNTVDTRPSELRSHRSLDLRWTWPSVAVIWTCAGALAVWSPDMVSGSEQEHLPLALITVWLWAASATAFAVLAPRRGNLLGWTIAVGIVWVVTLAVGVLAPELVTGSDLTRIPLAALVAPPVAAVFTGLLTLHEANRQLDTCASADGSAG